MTEVLASNAIDNDVAVVDDNIKALGHPANNIQLMLYMVPQIIMPVQIISIL